MKPAPFFPEIRDAVTGRIQPGLAGILRQIEKALEAQKRWKKQPGKAAEKTLRQEEARLRSLLRPRFRKAARPAGIPHDVAESFARAVLLSGHFRDTVGKRDARHILSSMPLATFPLYRVDAPDRPRAAKLAEGLAKALRLGPRERAAMARENEEAARRIRLKRRVIRALLDHFKIVRRAHLEPKAVAAFFRSLFVTSPLRPGEVDLVVTDTALYFCIPTQAAMAQSEGYRSRSAKEKAAVDAFLELAWRFRFDYFSHFPSFSFFDSRHSKGGLLASLEQRVPAAPAEIRECLNHAVGLLDRAQVEQYLIHDTWGHVWQDDLTEMRYLYDRMASLHYPLAPERTHNLSGNVVSIADLVSVSPGGRARLDRDTARRFIEEDLQEKVAALFAPILAEITADILEHKFLTDHPAQGHLLTSSSLFGQNPAKFDFTWNDLSFYLSVLKNPNEAYAKEPALEAGFLARLDWLLARKHPYLEASAAGRKRLVKPWREFLTLYRGTIAEHFHPELQVRGRGAETSISAFFQVYANALHIGYALNSLLVEEIGKSRPRWLRYREILVLFVIKFFERDPRRHFWRLDEVLADWALPLLAVLDRLDRPVRNPKPSPR